MVTVQLKRLQYSYVKIKFSVVTKTLTRMWMSLTSCGNSRHLCFPAVHSQTVPVLAGPESLLLSREPHIPVSHLRAGLAGSLLQTREISLLQSKPYMSKDSLSQIHMTGNSGFGGLVCSPASSGTYHTGSCKTILALGTQSTLSYWTKP